MKTYTTGAKLPGFSLMEMLIVVALFAISMLIISQTFMSFNRLHRRVANRALVNQESRYVMEMLVRAVRNRAFSYSPEPLAKDTQLRLMQSNGRELIIKKSVAGDPACGDIASVSCLLISFDSGSAWSPFTGKKVNVESFDVYLYPAQSPFVLAEGGYPNDSQPFVTINLRLKYMANIVEERESVQTQTTVASRIYLR